jgi:hypothetical protein
MDTAIVETAAIVPEHALAPEAAPAPPAPAPEAPVSLLPTAETVLSLQRTAGNVATQRAIGVSLDGRPPESRLARSAHAVVARELDPKTAAIEKQATEISATLETIDEEKSTTDSDAGTQRIFSIIGGLAMADMLDLSARLNQMGLLARVEALIPRSGLDKARIDELNAAFAKVRGGQADTSALGGDDKKAVDAFGPAKPGTSGDDPDGNTYVVYSGEIKTYFMTKVEPKRRSSVWLANNPGNSDELGGMGLGAGMKWGNHTFAIFPSMDAGRKALWEKIKEKSTLQAYLNYHLGQQGDGSFPEGNDPNAYLKHIQAKLNWVKFETSPKEIEDRGGIDGLLDGFMNAEGIVPGNTLKAGSAAVEASMTPTQQQTMTFYLKLLGLRS